MPFDEAGKWSWDGMKAGITDGQKACEQIAYRRGIWWVEECIVRDENNRIIGRIMARTLISDAAVPKAQDYVRVGIEEE